MCTREPRLCVCVRVCVSVAATVLLVCLFVLRCRRRRSAPLAWPPSGRRRRPALPKWYIPALMRARIIREEDVRTQRNARTVPPLRKMCVRASVAGKRTRLRILACCNREGKDMEATKRRRRRQRRRQRRERMRGQIHLACRLRLVFTNEFINYYNHSSEIASVALEQRTEIVRRGHRFNGCAFARLWCTYIY